MHFCLTIDHRSFADQRIAEQPTIHEGYIVQNMEKKGMIADHCEINRQIRADNQMLRELKTQVSKLAQAVKHSIPVIAETMETIRNHMIFTQYHLHHNEMQKEVIHDWMNHFNPILNKYNTVKKKLKAKVTERKKLNVQKDKTSILNPMFSPIVHGNLNIRGNRRCDKISLFDLRKCHMIWNYNFLKKEAHGSANPRLIYILLLFLTNSFNYTFPTHLFKLILWYHIRNPNKNWNHKHTWHYRKMQPEEKCRTERIY